MRLLDIRNLNIELLNLDQPVKAVESVNFSMYPSEVSGLIGESGSGKSLIAKALVGVLNNRWQVTADRFHFMGQDLNKMSMQKRKKIISENIAMIYQEPRRCLDPTSNIFSQLEESLPESYHSGWFNSKKKERVRKCIALLHKVGIKNHNEVFHSYPHMLSEGVCQKIMIAMAIAKQPKLLIADEPTTALESSTSLQVIKLLRSLNQLKDMAVIFITHNLNSITSWADTINVMYCGQLIESSSTKKILTAPKHPYTKALFDSEPDLSEQQNKNRTKLYALKGTIPTLQHLPIGCRLGPRCPNAQKACVIIPEPKKIKGQTFRCHYPLNIKELK
ncbi:MAG: ATP-binding cassette domain-containing protein [Gammaproteobacteria bacterium]|nr:ATP-binding cassette domain-containing protein [Gammaproteobacteria bacterium]